MKKTSVILLSACLSLAACGQRPQPAFTKRVQKTVPVEVKYTPVKNQGKSDLCWIYAMLATIESEHLMQGDSVNLSPLFSARMYLRQLAEKHYLEKSTGQLTLRGTPAMLIRQLTWYGTQPYDYYHGKETPDYDKILKKTAGLCEKAVSEKTGRIIFLQQLDELLDKEFGYMAKYVHMFGTEYTNLEFAHSVCRRDEYLYLTSFTHHPFGESFVLEIPDNYGQDAFLNLSLDSLMCRLDSALAAGHPVCWEGDISEKGFSFEEGVAELSDDELPVTQASRQAGFEQRRTTDDHCMTVLGRLKKNGRKYYVCKNSWGPDNSYGGMMMVSADYMAAKTIALYMSRAAWEGRRN